MDFSKIKNNKILQVSLIILVPTVLVAGYYGYKYAKSKNIFGKKTITDDTNSEGELLKEANVSDVNMEYFRIRLPFITDIINQTRKYLLLKGLPFKTISSSEGRDENSNRVFDYYIGIAPENVANLMVLIQSLGAGYSVKKVTKEQTALKPIEKPICVVKRDEINSYQEFFESIGCLKYSVLFGYSLIDIKNVPNIENKVSVDELRRVYNQANSKNWNISQQEREELTNIMKKIYAEDSV
jgi:hypothetical protein